MRISGNLHYLESKYAPYDKGLYLVEIDYGYQLILPSSHIEPEDLREMADHLEKIRGGLL